MDIVPSFIAKDMSYGYSSQSGKDIRFEEIKFRLGVVVDVFPPSDKNNKSKKYYEYAVDVFVMESAPTVKRYPAIVSDSFSAYADHFQYTPRKTDKSPKSYSTSKGSRVAVLCVNSDTQQALIVGGWPNPNLPVISDQPDKGHHLSFEFNGVQFDIDNDGNVRLVRKGATDEDGKVKEGYTEGSGTTIDLSKDGSIFLQTGSDSKMTFELNKNSGEVNLISEGNVNINCNGQNLNVAGKVVVNDGTHPMVRGDNLIQAISTLVASISTSLASGLATPAQGAAASTAINAALVKFTSDTGILSLGNKVD
jgi:hypothetical protein